MTTVGIISRLPALSNSRGWALLALGVLQIGVLAYIVGDRIRLLKTGREIVLPIIPVDPRDLFKGDYVQLGYGITMVPGNVVEGPAPAAAKPAYVTITPQPDGTWAATKITRNFPATTPEQVVLRALPASERAWQAGASNMRLRYGIERYYVQEGKGPALEKLARDKKLAAIVAVDSRGNAAIKGLSVDGQRVYDEPLY